MRQGMVAEESKMRADLPRRHDGGRVDPFECERIRRDRRRRNQLDLRRSALTRVDQLAKPAAADRVEHEVDSLRRSSVDDAMALEGVEYPAFAGSHVDALAAAFEDDARIGD